MVGCKTFRDCMNGRGQILTLLISPESLDIWGNSRIFAAIETYKTRKDMTAIALERETNNYWNLIKDPGNEVKLALIKRLSDAIASAVAEKNTRRKKYTADDFAGIWDDEHYMAAEDINKAIRDARHVKSSRDEIWDKL